MLEKQLIELISKETKQTQKQIKKTLNGFKKVLTKVLQADEDVMISKLGKFITAYRYERNGYNPFTMQPMVIKRTRVIKFRAGTNLKYQIKKPLKSL